MSGYGEFGLTRAFYCNELLGSPKSNKKEKGKKLVIYDGMIKVHNLHTYKVRTIQNSHCNLIFFFSKGPSIFYSLHSIASYFGLIDELMSPSESDMKPVNR